MKREPIFIKFIDQNMSFPGHHNIDSGVVHHPLILSPQTGPSTPRNRLESDAGPIAPGPTEKERRRGSTLLHDSQSHLAVPTSLFSAGAWSELRCIELPEKKFEEKFHPAKLLK
jgi:hypothetical protein